MILQLMSRLLLRDRFTRKITPCQFVAGFAVDTRPSDQIGPFRRRTGRLEVLVEEISYMGIF
jgi:hypothetical protein